jgi:hypothetical protein
VPLWPVFVHPLLSVFSQTAVLGLLFANPVLVWQTMRFYDVCLPWAPGDSCPGLLVWGYPSCVCLSAVVIASQAGFLENDHLGGQRPEKRTCSGNAPFEPAVQLFPVLAKLCVCPVFSLPPLVLPPPAYSCTSQGPGWHRTKLARFCQCQCQ